MLVIINYCFYHNSSNTGTLIMLLNHLFNIYERRLVCKHSQSKSWFLCRVKVKECKREIEKEMAGQGMTVYHCYQVITGTNLSF